MLYLYFIFLIRALRLSLRSWGDSALCLFFIFMATSLFPIAIGPDPIGLSKIAGGIIWVLVLITMLLSLDHLFQEDQEQGIIAQFALVGHDAFSPLMLYMLYGFAKASSHWILTALPLILLSPLLALMLNLPNAGFLPLISGLLLATPSLSLIGTMGAALSINTRRATILLSLIILPLYTPILIFAVMGLEASLSQLNPTPHYLLLGIMGLLSFLLCPIATAYALKNQQA